MKTIPVLTILAGCLSFTTTVSAQTRGTSGGAEQATSQANPAKPGGCGGCAQQPAGLAAKTTAPDDELKNMPNGRIENMIPIGMVVVLGCEKCASEVVGWALKQGSSFEDVDRALRTVAQVQRLECFNQAFGPDASARMEKPLAAARRTLQQAMDRAVPRD